MTGLAFNGCRDYDPRVGRCIEPDPTGLAAGPNPYAYVDGDPLERIDPEGLAYFAYRALNGLPWLGVFSSNPLDNALNDSISHEQLFFEDGGYPGNLGFFDDSRLHVDPSNSAWHKTGERYNDCLMRRAVDIVHLGKYHVVGNNCQTWASDVRNEYGSLLLDKAAARACGVK